MSAPSYRPDVDGLRGVAVLAVVLFHFGLGFDGGFVGVDVFFVISGYLITLLILRDVQSQTFSLTDFWERRFRRILPALAFVVFAVLIAGILILVPGDARSLGEAVIAQSLFLSNFHAWSHSGYFGRVAESMPLLHLWSLAIEEQFYLIFPICIWFARGWNRRSLIIATGLIAGLSLTLSIYGTHAYKTAPFYMLPTRAWELLTGSLLAMAPVPASHRKRLAEVCGVCGMATIFAACFLYRKTTLFPGLAAVLPCLGAAAVIWSGTAGSTLTRRILAWKPLVIVGLCSYSIYLWHWPVLVYARYWSEAPLSAIQCVVLIALIFVLAVLTLHGIERPFRQKRLAASRGPLFAASFSMLAGLCLAGYLTSATDLVESRFDPQLVDLFEKIDSENSQQEKLRTDVSVSELQRGIVDELTPELQDQPIGCLLWGDSTARPLRSVFGDLGRSHSLRTVAIVRASTAPAQGFRGNSAVTSHIRMTKTYNGLAMKYIIDHQIPHVVMCSRWIGFNLDDHGTEHDRNLTDCLRDTVHTLRSAGVHVWIMRQAPEQEKDVRRQIARLYDGQITNLNGISEADHVRRQAPANQMLDLMVAEGAQMIDPAPVLQGNDGCYRLLVDGTPLYRNGAHLSEKGGQFIKPLFESVFLQIGRQTASLPLDSLQR